MLATFGSIIGEWGGEDDKARVHFALHQAKTVRWGGGAAGDVLLCACQPPGKHNQLLKKA